MLLPAPVSVSAATVRLKALRRPRWIAAILVLFFLWLVLPFFAHHRPPPLPVPFPPPPRTATANRIRNAFIHAYTGYLTHAFPDDELRPLSLRNHTNLNGWGLTVFDGLDTMWIMSIPELWDHAVEFIAEHQFPMQPKDFAPFFETNIRYLGGMLSAYALSGNPLLLEKADELGASMLPALDTPSGLPAFAVNTQSGLTRPGWTGGTLWAEALSCQLEYKYLAHLTSNPTYFTKVENIMAMMETANLTGPGLFPTIWDTRTGTSNGRVFSAGAFADSAHEYFLKQYLLTSHSEPRALSLYIDVAEAIIDHLLYYLPFRDFLYVTDIDLPTMKPSYKFEHLSCFLPGMLMLGVHTLSDKLTPEQATKHKWAARGLAKACWLTYADMPSGLGPDEVTMQKEGSLAWVRAYAEWQQKGGKGDAPGSRETEPEPDPDLRYYKIRKPAFLLRPEALESFYVLWRLGEGDVWKERSWKVFEAIEAVARTPEAYASVTDVEHPVLDGGFKLKDEMPSYFLAETLKYLYLMFNDDVEYSFEKWVFNTEAHPLPVFHWSEAEKLAYNISYDSDRL